jgi:hypothetical protein
MAEVHYSITSHNGTVTFRYGKYVESFDIRDLGFLQTYERIKFAAITAGLPLNEDTLQDLFREIKGLK